MSCIGHHIKDRFEKLTANSFSEASLPAACRSRSTSPNDGPENYSYSAVAPPIEPENDGVVPPLVLKARQMGMGLDV
jgi:hypothetical protein